MYVRVGPYRRLSAKELMLLNCGVVKTLESPLDCKEIKPVNLKGNQSWIFIGRTDAEAETPILWPPHARVDSLEKTLMLGKIEGRSRRGWQRTRWLDGITNSMGMSLSKVRRLWTGKPSMLQSMGSQRVGYDWAAEQQPLSNFRTLTILPNGNHHLRSTTHTFPRCSGLPGFSHFALLDTHTSSVLFSLNFPSPCLDPMNTCQTLF